jgi:uncharacterized membrane protein YsdA (DUF1294 family)
VNDPWHYVVGYVAWCGLISLGAVVLLAVDKRRARRGRYRVSEKTLHLLELAGGWPGSWIARRRLRHKTRKASYRIVFAAIVLLHLALIGAFAAYQLGWL